MKYAVIQAGGKQQLVEVGQELNIDLVSGKKTVEFEPLLIIDEKKASIGGPTIKGKTVKAEVVEPKLAGQKLRVIRYKAKKRVNKQTGHRQKYSKIKITAIG